MGGKTLARKKKELRELKKTEILSELRAKLKFALSEEGIKKFAMDNLNRFLEPPNFMELVSTVGVAMLIKGVVVESTETWFTSFPLGFAKLFRIIPPETADQIAELMDMPAVEVVQWVTSFAVAYIIVHNFGEIAAGLQSLGGGLFGLARLLVTP